MKDGKNNSMGKLKEYGRIVNDKYFKAIVETMKEPLILLDRDLRVISANSAFYDTFNVNKNDTNRSIYDLGNKQWDIPELKMLLEGILPHKKRLNDFKIKHKFPVIGEKVMLLNAQQLAPLNIVILTISDVTEREKLALEAKKCDNTLRDLSDVSVLESKTSTIFLKHAMNALNDIFYMCDLKCNLLNWNRSFSEITGYSNEELLSKKMTDFFSGKDRRNISKITADLFKRSKIVHTASLVSKDGRRLPYEFTCTALTDTSNKVIGFSGTGRDRSRRIMIEESLKDATQQLDTIFHNINIGISLSRLSDGKILNINEEFLRETGYKRAEVIGNTSQNLHLWHARSDRINLLKKMVRRGNAEVQTKWRNKSGELRHMDVKTNLVIIGGEKYILGFISDITAKKEAKEKYNMLYRTSNDALMTVDIHSGKFTSGNPAAIKMFCCKNEQDFVSHRPWDFSPEKQPDGQKSSDKAKRMNERAIKRGHILFGWTYRTIHKWKRRGVSCNCFVE